MATQVAQGHEESWDENDLVIRYFFIVSNQDLL